MKTIEVRLENCYGIGNLYHTFDFEKSSTFLVYAPNGTMKTSLAKTLRYFAGENVGKPCDQIYTNRKGLFEVKIDGVEVTIPEERILIIDPDIANYDASHKISNFIASRDLKKEFDDIYNELESRRIEFIKKLKITSQSTDCESEIIGAFSIKGNENFFDILDNVFPLLEDKHEKYDFRYNAIFDKKGNVKKFLSKHQADLDTYVSDYESLISKSDFFKKSNNSFGTYQAGEMLKSIKDGSFFEAGHSLRLKGELKIDSAEELKELVENEINKVINDKKLKDTFDKIDKTLGTNEELRAFKVAIEENNLLLIGLKDYEGFKKRVWLAYLNEIKEDATVLHTFYSSKRTELSLLFTKAKAESEIWLNLISQFNARFHVPFTVELANQEDIILKEELPVLHFLYSDRSEPAVKQEKDALFSNVLSRGEKRALYILQVLFEIESKKVTQSEVFAVFDDVADSFDYKNKYAVIEYIKDLAESGKFNILILTHNFDFYRTVASRLELPRESAVLMAVRGEQGEITLQRGEYVKDIFQHFLGRVTEEKVFISLIPFLRNIIEYTEGHTSPEYLKLTSCLHKKTDTDSIVINDILDIWKQRFQKYTTNFQAITFSASYVKDIIYKVAEKIITEQVTNEIPLENKIVLSIAIRLKADEFMLTMIGIPGLDAITISNPTAKLFSQYKAISTDDQKVKILGRVMLMTPENIHLNAFMYEPLIDVSLRHLVTLYVEVKSL